MRKRPSRPQRFVALDNGSVDTLRSMTAKGLLATLIRAKDGDDVTVEGLCKTHTEGREVLTKAMRALVEDAFVVKFKIQRERSETVELEDGTTETKRGGSWYTTFTVDSIPFSLEDVTGMLKDIYDGGNVKAVRVEPTHLDPRKAASEDPRPTAGFPSVGATCENTGSEGGEIENGQVGPTDGFPTVGRPTVGRSAAHIRKKTVSKDSLFPVAPSVSAEAGERDSAAQNDLHADAGQVLAAYEQALGGPALNGTRAQLLKDASDLLEARPLSWVIDRARELPKYGKSLMRHAEMSKVPFNEQASIPAARKACPLNACDGGGIVYRDPELMLGPSRCACRSQHAPA